MDAYMGEIRFFAFMPYGEGDGGPLWHYCDGTELPIQGNEFLFSMIGFHFGGNGQTTFALPDLRGRVPIGCGQDDFGNTYTLGQSGGQDVVALGAQHVAPHNHPVHATTEVGTGARPRGRFPATVTGVDANDTPIPVYAALTDDSVQLAAATVADAGGGVGHNNIQPCKVLGYYICIHGLYPTRP